LAKNKSGRSNLCLVSRPLTSEQLEFCHSVLMSDYQLRN
jgi:hypothetical protein